MCAVHISQESCFTFTHFLYSLIADFWQHSNTQFFYFPWSRTAQRMINVLSFWASKYGCGFYGSSLEREKYRISKARSVLQPTAWKSWQLSTIVAAAMNNPIIFLFSQSIAKASSLWPAGDWTLLPIKSIRHVATAEQVTGCLTAVL